MNSTTKKKADAIAGVDKAPAASSFPKIGDVVLYAHRGLNMKSDIYTLVPMIVTKAYDNDNTIDGVIFSTDRHLFPNGHSKAVEKVIKGESEGTWQHRQ